MVVPIRVSADDGRMTGEIFRTKLQAKCLCFFHGQAVVGCIAWVKADDILVTFDITMLGISENILIHGLHGFAQGIEPI